MLWILVRTPESEADVKQIVRPSSSNLLTPTGEETAIQLGNILSRVNIDEILTSSQDPAAMGIQYIIGTQYLTAHREIPSYKLVDQLIEVSFGDLTGMTANQIKDAWLNYALEHDTDINKYSFLHRYDLRYMRRDMRGDLEELGLESLRDLEDRLSRLLSLMEVKAKQKQQHVVTITGPMLTAYLVERIKYNTFGEHMEIRGKGGLFPQNYKEVTLVNIDPKLGIRSIEFNVSFSQLQVISASPRGYSYHTLGVHHGS
ncbi:MAG: histidine phosphatase family protein [Candidatus Woesearchaeota archaeon]|jgi:broad specificity phosphatase PhoE